MTGRISMAVAPGKDSLVIGSETTASGAGIIRALERCDLAEVADMFGRVFRKDSPVRHRAVLAALEAVYLDAPAGRVRSGSLVHVGPRGRIDGFIGIIDIGMMIQDRPARCGILGAFMTDGGATPSAAGARLARAAVNQSYDLFFSDTASPQSLAIARALRFRHLPLGSLRWTRVLRPAAVAAASLGRRHRALGSAAALAARALDPPLTRLSGAFGRPTAIDGVTHRAISFDEFLLGADAFTAHHALRPAWGDPSLRWALLRAAQCSADKRLHAGEVLDTGGRRIGLHLAYTAADGLASALQVLSLPRKERLVYPAVVAWASEAGAAAISGVASPDSIAGLAGQPGLYYRGGMSAIVRSRDPAIIRAVETGDCMLGGLVGETWTSVVADDFV